MAISREFLAGHIAEHGPWLYHVCSGYEQTTDEMVVAQVLRGQGLIPWNQGPDSNYAGDAGEPRPDHVYLSTPAGFGQIVRMLGVPETGGGTPVLARQAVAVDVRALDCAAINPDEDCCYPSSYLTWVGKREPLLPAGTPCAWATVADWEIPVNVTGRDVDPDWAAVRPHHSYGQWADAVELGRDLAHTQACWTRFGSIAHHGPIAAHAIRAVSAAELDGLLDARTLAMAA